ncbi:hypothetical protein P8452_64425 [Trifolium repens]|nr:hypothetical protein P8452_64425 [Trifolium repens]
MSQITWGWEKDEDGGREPLSDFHVLLCPTLFLSQAAAPPILRFRSPLLALKPPAQGAPSLSTLSFSLWLRAAVTSLSLSHKSQFLRLEQDL